MKNGTIIIAIIAIAAMILLLFRRCGNESSTTTVTTIRTVVPADSIHAIPVPEPVEVDDFDALIAKGVELDSLRAILRHVASRYQFYKAETLSLREQIAAMQSMIESDDCAEREAAWKTQAEKLRGRNDQLDLLIDSLFTSLADARKVNSYTFREQDEYQQRTTELTVVGWLPPGGYQVSKRYFIPETHTTKVNGDAVRRHGIAAMIGMQYQDGSIYPSYHLQYQRAGRVGYVTQLGYVPQLQSIAPAGGIMVRF